MPSIEDEIQALRKKRVRALTVIGFIAVGAVLLYLGATKGRGPASLLADISTTVQPDITATTTTTDATDTTMQTAAQATTTPTPTAAVVTDISPAAASPAPEAVAIAVATTTEIAPAAITTTTTTETASATIPTTSAGTAPTSTPFEFENVLQAASSSVKALPYTASTFTSGDGWEDWWGDLSETSGTLAVGATASTTGGGALLNGSGGWTDYTFQATLDWVKGGSFGLLARFTSDADYVACEFNQPSPGETRMYLDRYIGGTGTTITSEDVSSYNQNGGTNIQASIAVHGPQVACSFNGATIANMIEGGSVSLPAAGGIGFTAWDPGTNNSQIVVHAANVSVP